MTIYDIAEKANVSASTISRVINNKPGVSEKKRREIQKLSANDESKAACPNVFCPAAASGDWPL